MAVTLAEARLFLYIDGLDREVDAQIQKMIDVATAILERRAPSAPEAVRDQAVLRVTGALYDERGVTGGEEASRPISHSALLQACGALALVKPWVIRRLLS